MNSEVDNSRMLSQTRLAALINDNLRGLQLKIRRASLVLAAIGLTLLCVSLAQAANFQVTTTIDNGSNTTPTPGSLRKAILDANANAGPDVIDFNIPGSNVHTIAPSTPLPAITGATTIDGYTQPGTSQNTLPDGDDAILLIELDGTNAGASADGLKITAAGCTVRGLVINRFTDAAIFVDLAPTFPNNVVIEGNFIGTDASGSVALGNGTAALTGGVHISGAGNTVGGTTPQSRNVISGMNGQDSFGVMIGFPSSSATNIVKGNFIGTDKTGKIKLGNSVGVSVFNSSGNTIGGVASGARNVISGNLIGVRLAVGSNTNGISGNYIGTDVTGAAPLGNEFGVTAQQTSIGNGIGGNTSGAANVIAFNNRNGVAIYDDSQIAITRNSIYSNKNLGIDLNGNGVTANDLNDGDSGPNGFQNFPAITSAISVGGLTVLQGVLNSVPNTQFNIEFFGNDTADASGFGEGKNFLGATTVTTDANGNASFNSNLVTFSTPTFVSATATSITGDTSEFSVSMKVNAPPPAISINDISILEGTGSKPMAMFTLSLSAPNSVPVTVNYSTADGSAKAGSDYDATSGVVTFDPGQLAQTIQVPVNGDSLLEPDENFFVNLTNPTNGTIAKNQGACIIINDDLPQPGVLSFSTSSYSFPEGIGNATITVKRLNGSDGAISVQLQTIQNGTASAGADYTTTNATLNWADGDSADKTVMVPVVDDALNEGNETLTLSLSNPTGGAQLGNPKLASLMIVDNDPLPQLSINNVTVKEGDAGTTSAVFTVSLSAPSGLDVTVKYGTADGTATSANDYVSQSGTLTFPAGQVSQTISISINGDTQPEVDETFVVNLSNQSNANIAQSHGTGTILNDDGSPQFGSLQFSSASYTVNESGGQLAITVTRSGGSSGAVSVVFGSSDGTAIMEKDYTGATGVLSWADGDATPKTFTIAVLDDSLDEASETINLALSNPTGGATLGSPANAVLTIVDDDPAPKVSIDDVSLAEGNSGTTNFTFSVSLSAESGQTVSVNYTTADNTAQSGSDYQAANGVVTFAPGETSKQVTVLVNGDVQAEPDETFVVNLYNLINASVGKVNGLGKIIDDDSTPPSPTIQFDQAGYFVQEDLGAMTITVTRSGDTSSAASVDYTTADGSAAQKTDFEYAAGTLTFAAGETSKTLTILLNEDSLVEGNETFNVTLSNPAGAVLGPQNSTTVTIADDLSEPLVSPVDDAQSFVHTHYHDFLNREPDAAGLAFWTSQITACGTDAKCIDAARVNVSASFFLSIEFQETAYLLYLMQKESYASMPKYTSFMRDLQEVSRGVVVNSPGWQQKLSGNQQQFADQWVNRPEFKAAYDALSNDAYVDALYKNAGIVAPQAEKDKLVAALNGASMNRSAVLLEVAADSTFRQQEQNAAFVLMEYFGYLRRDPSASPDADFSGYNFWLNKLNQFNGNYVDAEMIKAFITSFEYRQRFGQ